MPGACEEELFVIVNPVVAAACAIVAGCLASAVAFAQRPPNEYPVKPIRLIVPFVAGGPMDVIGRLVGQKLQASWGQNVIIDNRAGAGGIIGTEVAAKAAPDGYTLLHTSSAHAMLPAFNKLPYDPVRDFAALTPATRTVGYVLAVHPSMPVRSVGELVALAKREPGKLNYGNSGHGGVLHVAMELFNSTAHIRMTTVQYKGIGQLVTDLAGGHIELAFLTPSNAVGMVQGGKTRAIGISGGKRWKQLPDVPTIGEAGLKGFEYYAWFGFWAPANTPADVLGRLHAEIVRAAAAPDVVQRFDEIGFETYTMKPEEFTRLVERDIEATKKIAARLGAAPQ
jgi:tripartite-type tricarboxylate transporter receptor subunit TctC